MSALAHLLEARGLPTTVLALVLPQVENTRPPRALFLPFLLGRPLGEPNDPAFQRRVLLQALRLLERTDGKVILEHFADDPPSWFDRTDWQPAVRLERPASPTNAPASPTHAAEWEAAFRLELALVLPAWERFKARFGRTTTGLAGQDPDAWPAFAASFLNGDLPVASLHDRERRGPLLLSRAALVASVLSEPVEGRSAGDRAGYFSQSHGGEFD